VGNIQPLLTIIWTLVTVIFKLDASVKQLEEFLDNAGITQDGQGDSANMTEDNIGELFHNINRSAGIAITAYIET
jgi:hypothetical protein